MPNNRVVGQWTVSHKKIIAEGHHPIVRNRQFESGQGTIESGNVVAENGGALIKWDGTTGSIEGVLAETIDTETQSTAPVLEHGEAIRDNVTVVDVAITPAQEKALKAKSIWLT